MRGISSRKKAPTRARKQKQDKNDQNLIIFERKKKQKKNEGHKYQKGWAGRGDARDKFNECMALRLEIACTRATRRHEWHSLERV